MSMNAATSVPAGLVASDRRGPRARVRLAAIAIGMALAAGLVYRVAAEEDRAPTTLILPPSIPFASAERLQTLHARYEAIAIASGVPAMRARIIADIKAFRGDEAWTEAVIHWIERAAWRDAADLCIDAAETADPLNRLSCAAMLCCKESHLLHASEHGPRIRALRDAEADEATRVYWTDLLKRLEKN